MKVKVRIALSIDNEGGWYACGWRGAEDQIMRDCTLETLETGEKHYWVELEVECPRAETLQAEAKAA